MRRLVVEADGGSRGNPGPAAYGALVRDPASGEVVAEVAEHIGRATNNVAEYRGLIAGLRLAATLDPAAELEVRMDSKLVVEQMSGRWKVKHPDMKPLALEASRAWPAERVRYRWVPRAQNSDADRLANEALDAAARGEAWTPQGVPAGTSYGATPAAPVDEPPPAAAAEEPAPQVPPTRVPGWGDVGAPTTLLLVRHGETVDTVGQRFSGTGGADPELSADGRTQVSSLAAALAAGGGIDAVVSSPLRRCRETAETVAGALGLPVRVEEGFTEARFGAWEGLAFSEVQQRSPDELQAWLDSPAVAPPGGESLDEVARRVRVARDKVLARYPGQTVVVATHVTPITQLVRLALDAPPHAVWRMQISPASVTALQWWADGGVSLRAYNETGHLR